MDTEVNMKTNDVKCPVCGSMNHSLYLEETEGWMECLHQILRLLRQLRLHGQIHS